MSSPPRVHNTMKKKKHNHKKNLPKQKKNKQQFTKRKKNVITRGTFLNKSAIRILSSVYSSPHFLIVSALSFAMIPFNFKGSKNFMLVIVQGTLEWCMARTVPSMTGLIHSLWFWIFIFFFFLRFFFVRFYYLRTLSFNFIFFFNEQGVKSNTAK